ncbi:MAG TPA: His/Gly/Thr/Pro-type tRNA ligase C-terminal domain-containing protein, partial [Candidatus Dojkabacteria bacterium]|nr:His/Gly/Thr/Pro-type tRNA ligase C-terminal domain-containing protein [Candidatus Dojkabacteria bacterium]
IDIKAKDVLGRKHQLTTIQVDFNLPERFDMKYTADDGNEKRPIMIHRALLGSLERFIAILIEHYGGIFPLWLSYEQVRIIPINDQLGLVKYVDEVKEQLKNMGVRVKIDDRSESMQKKIRDCEIDKIPYMLIIGEKEKNTNTVSVRSLKEKDKGLMKVEEIANLINQDS